MEYFIRDHLSDYGVLIAIFPLDIKTSIVEKDKLTVSFYNASGNMKWGYEKDILESFYDEKIYGSSLIPKVYFKSNSDEISLSHTFESRIKWHANGVLKKEFFNDRIVDHHNGNMIISFDGFIFIYNVENYLEEDKKPPALLILNRLKDYLKRVEKGIVDLLDFESEVYFYIDDDKVNIVFYFSPSRKDKFIEMVKDNPAKIKEEAEKLRKDPRKYKPKLFD